MRKMIFPLLTEDVKKLPFYVTSVGGNFPQVQMVRPEGYTSYHLLYTASGKGKLLIGGDEYIIGENTGFFFYPGIPHEYYAVVNPWNTLWVTFDGHGVQKLLNHMKVDKYKIFTVTDYNLLESMHTEIYNIASAESPTKDYDSSASLYRFLLGLKYCTTLWDSEQKTGNLKKLQPLRSYIEQNYMNQLTLADMANVLGVSPQHLCRLFKQTLNMRPFEFLTRFRLQKAKEILAGTDTPLLAEVASLTGFNDVSYFCAVFKEYEGMTPVEFRKMHKDA